VSELYDWRFLGLSNIKSNTYGVAEVGFFQIFNSRLKAVKEQQPPLTPATVTEDAFTPTSAPIADDSAVSATMSTGEGDPVTDDRPSNQRPYSLVVSCNTQIFKPSNQQPYYIFPHNAIVETVTQVPPYEVSSDA
jgi:hypothetical protein